MLDTVRDIAYQALRSSRGNVLPPVRWAKDLVLFMNEMAGKPLATRDEIALRRERERVRQEKLAEALAKRAAEEAKAAGPAKEVAPVVIYRDDKSTRDLKRIESVLKGRDIAWKEIDVEHDEAGKSWVVTRSGTHDLPVVFIAGEPVGGYDALVQLDVAGELTKRVFGS
jgi:glutaredoxin 3